MTQQEFDDKIYVAGRKAEDFLKEKYKEHDFDAEIEKFIDSKEETLHSLTDNPVKFDLFLKDFDNLQKVNDDFRTNIKQMYPSFNLEFADGGETKPKKVIRRNLPINKEYKLIDSFYTGGLEENPMTCENCGRPIANVAVIGDNDGKTYDVGMDCAETLSQIKNSLEFMATQNDFKEATAIRNKIRKAVKEGTVIQAENTFFGNVYISGKKDGRNQFNIPVEKAFFFKYLPDFKKEIINSEKNDFVPRFFDNHNFGFNFSYFKDKVVEPKEFTIGEYTAKVRRFDKPNYAEDGTLRNINNLIGVEVFKSGVLIGEDSFYMPQDVPSKIINTINKYEFNNFIGDSIKMKDGGEIISSDSFKNWFEKSKVVDKLGNPLVCYHGTNENFNEFDTSEKLAWFTPDKKEAKWYSDQRIKRKGGKIIEVFLKMINPLDLYNSGYDNALSNISVSEVEKISGIQIPKDKKGDENYKMPMWILLEHKIFLDEVKNNGYDGLIVKEDGNKHYAVFDSSQIKLADGSNTTFDTNNPDIRFSKGGIVTHYPIAPRDEWYGEANYDSVGGKLIMMSPTDYLKSVRPLIIDDGSRDNIDDLKNHILSGKTLDPLVIYENGKEDGRHRAYASLELGIKQVPVIIFNEGGNVAPKKAIIVHNNTNSAYDQDAQKLLIEYLKNLNDSGRKVFAKALEKTGQNFNDFDVVFYLNHFYHPTHTDKFYSNKLLYRKTIPEAYNDALNGDDESPNYIRIWKKDGVTHYIVSPESTLFGGYIGDKYDDKGYLKQEVKDLAIAILTNDLTPRVQLADGGSIIEGVSNKEFAAKSDKYFEYVPIEEIEKYKEFDREVEIKFDKSELDELTDKIRLNGITFPIILEVYDGKGIVVEGNHRIAAAKRLGIKNIPVRIIERTRPFKGTVYESKAKDLPSMSNFQKANTIYGVDIKDSSNSAAVYGFTKIEPVKSLQEIEMLSDNLSTEFDEGGQVLSKPAYLMTLQEYQQTVTPILQEYNKFVNKNLKYLAKVDFSGILYYTFPELLSEVNNGTQKGFSFTRGQYDKDYTNDEFARKSFGYKKTGSFNTDYEPEPTPQGLTEKKNEYLDKLRVFFTEDEIVRMIDKDETKSNKRSIRRAIDKDTYKKLLAEGTVKLDVIEKAAESVGVRLPKKIFDEGTIKANENKALYDKIYASMPSVNAKVLSKLVDDIKETFKPLEKIIYDRETERYQTSISKTLNKNEADIRILNGWLNFYENIFNYEKTEERKRQGKDKWGRAAIVTDNWIIGLSLKDGWKEVVSKAVLSEIEELKGNMIYSIVSNFQKITLPIESIEQVSLEVGNKGFEGSYRFNFKNGSSFIFKTEAIGAGGYNIQKFHFRYLTNFTDVTLADGTKTSGSYAVLQNFSEKDKFAKGGQIEYKKELVNKLLNSNDDDLYYRTIYFNSGGISTIEIKDYGYKVDNYLITKRGIYLFDENVKLSKKRTDSKLFKQQIHDELMEKLNHAEQTEIAIEKSVSFIESLPTIYAKDIKEGDVFKIYEIKNNEVIGNIIYKAINSDGTYVDSEVMEIEGEIQSLEDLKVGEKINEAIRTQAFGEKIEKFDIGGSVSNKNIYSASSRFRPYETIAFNPPIEGVNGAKLLAYTWAYEWKEEFNPIVGEDVTKRISDWSQAETNAETGRNIVHQFFVQLANGEKKTVSSESVLVLLGYTEAQQLKSFPSLVAALKTLSKQKMQLSILEAKQKEYDEALEKISKQEKPPIVEKEYKKRESNGGTTVYSMGESTVWQNDKPSYDAQLGKSIYTKLGHIEDERKEALIDGWIRQELIELGVSKPYGIGDLKNRINRQEKKVEQLTGGSLSVKMEDGGELKTIQYGDYVTFTKDSVDTTPSGSLLYKSGSGGNVVNIKEKEGKIFYTIKKGMTSITDVPATDVVLHKKDVREKVEKILTERQEKKGFKDIGKRVSGSQKEKVILNNIINLSDLKTIEEDEITAIKTVVKERVYPEINIEEQKAMGVTSGAAFIKVETRKSCGTKPPNDKNKRTSYVKFINKFTEDTYNVKTVNEIRTIYESYLNWTPSEIIGYFLDPSFLDAPPEIKEKLEKFFKEKFKFGSSRLIKQLITEIFGKRLENFMFRDSDTARQTWQEALSFEPISKEMSDLLISAARERKQIFIKANKEKADLFEKANVQELKSEMSGFTFGTHHRRLFQENIENFRNWVVDYYRKREQDGIKSLDVPVPEYQQRENNWSWYEQSPEKRTIEKSKEIKINSGKPLAFIKRVGGVKIADEYVSSTQNTDLTKNPITNDFGFKTVQFGQSLNDKSAREHIRHFLGAMSDLSEILDIDIKSLNNIGELSIAFAARGKGNAMAHYEEGRKIINITNKRGDGTITHEYFHYIDNALTTIGKEGISLIFGTDEPDKILNKNVADRVIAIMDFFYKGKSGITVPVKVLFKKEARGYQSVPKFYSSKFGQKEVSILDTIDETIERLRIEYPDIVSINTKYPDYQKSIFGYIINHFGLNEYEVPLSTLSSNFYYGSNKMQSAYWIKAYELFARASETYIYDKLIKMGRFNNYLVNDDMFGELLLNDGSYTYVYPYGAEREYLYTLYDDLINTMKVEYNLSVFKPVSDKREDEYLVLEEKQDVDENVDAGVVVDAKTDKVEEIIHDNIEIKEPEKVIENKEVGTNNIKIFNYHKFKKGDYIPVSEGKIDRRIYFFDDKYYYQELPKYKLSADWNRDKLNGYDSIKQAVEDVFPTDLGQSGDYYLYKHKNFNPKNILSRYIVLEAIDKETKEKTYIVLLKIAPEQTKEITESWGDFEKKLEAKDLENKYTFKNVTLEAKFFQYEQQIENKDNPKYARRPKKDAYCGWFGLEGFVPSAKVAPTVKSKYHSFYYYEKGGRWIPVDDYKTKWLDRDIVIVYIKDNDNSKIESYYKEAGEPRKTKDSYNLCYYWLNSEHMTPVQYIRVKEQLEKLSLEKLTSDKKIDVNKTAEKEIKVELTKENYDEAIDLAIQMADMSEGEEKKHWLDYIDVLRLMTESGSSTENKEMKKTNIPTIGSSKSVEEAKLLLPTIMKQVDEANFSIPTVERVIDWGAKQRGQGKRSGSMVKGSMSAAPHGLKKYYGVDLSEYKNDFNGEITKLLDGHQVARYYKARKFGLNEIEARLYALY